MSINVVVVLLVAASLNQLVNAAVSSSNCCADMPQIIADLQGQIDTVNARVNKIQSSGGGGGDCPVGYVFLKPLGKCYRLNTDSETWEQAMATCATSGGDLAKITSQQENDVIVAYLKSLGATLTSYCTGVNAVWLAAQRSDPNSCSTPFVWKTSEGTSSALRYSHWNTGEPNCASGIEKCATLYADPQLGGQWNDRDCNSRLCSLCQA